MVSLYRGRMFVVLSLILQLVSSDRPLTKNNSTALLNVSARDSMQRFSVTWAFGLLTLATNIHSNHASLVASTTDEERIANVNIELKKLPDLGQTFEIAKLNDGLDPHPIATFAPDSVTRNRPTQNELDGMADKYLREEVGKKNESLTAHWRELRELRQRKVNGEPMNSSDLRKHENRRNHNLNKFNQGMAFVFFTEFGKIIDSATGRLVTHELYDAVTELVGQYDFIWPMAQSMTDLTDRSKNLDKTEFAINLQKRLNTILGLLKIKDKASVTHIIAVSERVRVEQAINDLDPGSPDLLYLTEQAVAMDKMIDENDFLEGQAIFDHIKDKITISEAWLLWGRSWKNGFMVAFTFAAYLL